MLANFKSGEWQFIDDVPTNDIPQLKQDYRDNFVTIGNIGTYYLCWNINEDILPPGMNLEWEEAERARAEIRRAIMLLFDRDYLVTNVSQGGEVPAASFVAMGLSDYDGTDFYLHAGSSNKYPGYYDMSSGAMESNYEEALSVLKKYYTYEATSGTFVNFPTLTYLYNTSEQHQAIAEYIQSVFAGIGITIKLDNEEWASFLNTRKDGAYTVARNGWIADYNDPICFLDLWTTISGNNDVQFGKDAHAKLKNYSLDLTPWGYDISVRNGTWAETYDVLISTIKSCTDAEKRYEMMHLAEDMLMETGCICPLYYYTDIYMIDSSLKGFFASPLATKYFMYTHY